MFLIRTAFWIGLVVLLLPTDEKSQTKLVAQAQSALHWTWTFCDRNPVSCEKGAEGWALFLRKAEFGFALATGMVKEWSEKAAAEASAQQGKAVIAPAVAPGPPGTPHQPAQRLKREDMVPPWRGPAGPPVRTGA